MNASDILRKSAQHIEDRAAARDQAQGERSMARTVAAFNALTGHQLSERDGWLFMVQLKMARACTTPTGIPDDYEDGASYVALAGESVAVPVNDNVPKPGEVVHVVPIEGFNVQLAIGHEWYAQDACGVWNSFNEAPIPGGSCWMVGYGAEVFRLHEGHPNKRWKETLQSVHLK